MIRPSSLRLALCASLAAVCLPAIAEDKAAEGILKVPSTSDFEVTGDGRNDAWAKVDWTALTLRSPGAAPQASRVKMLYSTTGLYVLFDGVDKKITATMKEDFLDLWNEDVFEVFLWPEEKFPLYFEYEISPLGYELPILIPNLDNRIMGWRPWHYEGKKKIKKATAVRGGAKESTSAIAGWSAEIFIPYELLQPLGNVPPRAGAQWRANFYRVDYDQGKAAEWTWVPVGESFHDFQKFGKLVFQ